MNKILISGFVFFLSSTAVFSDDLSQDQDGNKTARLPRTCDGLSLSPVSATPSDRSGRELPNLVQNRDSDGNANTDRSSCEASDNLTGVFLSASGGGACTAGGTVDWRAFEIRVGKVLTDRIRLDFIHYNEAHLLQHNHRDGFALEAVCEIPVSRRFRFDVGAGPYFSMNTHDILGLEYDDKRLGLLGSAAIAYYLDEISPNLSLRAEWNHAWMPAAITTDALMFGLGWDFGGRRTEHDRRPAYDPLKDDQLEIGVGADWFKTNRGGTSAAAGYNVEVGRFVAENVKVSFSFIAEGEDKLVDRKGVAGQVWYEMPLDEKKNWSVSAGAGPYLAMNERGSRSPECDGIISMQVARKVGRHVKLYFRFSRIADLPSSETDRDMGTGGVLFTF